MTTVIAQSSPQLARQVARAADTLGLTHSELTVEAVRQFVRAIAPLKRARKKRSHMGSAK